MRKQIKKIFTCAVAVVTFATALLTSPVPTKAEGQDLTYNETANSMNGNFTTSDEVTKIEVYYSSGYSFLNTWFMLADNPKKQAKLSEVPSGADVSITDSLEIIGGGTTDVPGYSLKCTSYYIVSKSADAETWTFSIERNNTLSECFVVKSEIPADWQKAGAVITEPSEFLLGFIDSNLSQYTVSDIVPIISTLSEGTEATKQYEETIPEQEKQEDPLVGILIIMILIVLIAIVITFMVYVKTKKENARKQSEEFVKKANDKAKAKKLKDNDDLLEIMDSYHMEYSDDCDDDFDYDIDDDSNEPEESSYEYDDYNDDEYEDYDADEEEISHTATATVRIPDKERPVKPLHEEDEFISESDGTSLLTDERLAALMAEIERLKAENKTLKSIEQPKEEQKVVKITKEQRPAPRKKEIVKSTVEPKAAVKPVAKPKFDAGQPAKTSAPVKSKTNAKKVPAFVKQVQQNK